MTDEITSTEVKPLEIKAKAPKANDGKGAEASFFFMFPKTAEECILEFGDETVRSAFVAAQTVKAQAGIRSLLEAGKTPAEVSEYMTGNWQPGVTISDPTVNVIAKFKAMSAADRAAFLEQLQAAASEE
jgi:hypothetical protein